MIENIFLTLTLFTMLLGMVFICYSIYICKKVVPMVDHHLQGWHYDYDSWFAQILRANEYTSYSMLPSRAMKDGVYDKFYTMDPWIRRHFLIWMGMALFGIFLIAIVAILQNFFLEK